MSNTLVNLLTSILGSIVGFIVGTLAWHTSEYIKRKQMKKQRVWDILNGK